MNDPNMNSLPNLLGPVPNKHADGTKVPSVYNAIMSKVMGKSDVIIQPKVAIFELNNSGGRADYEELMLKINTSPEKLHYIQAKDHWTKEGEFLRAIDYVEFTAEEKEDDKEDIDSPSPVLNDKIKKDLKERLDNKHKEVQEELNEKEEVIKEEVDKDIKKIEDAVVEKDIVGPR